MKTLSYFESAMTNSNISDTRQTASPMQHSFEYSDADFHRLQKLVSDHTGISLSDSKRDLVYGRLAKRLRKLGLKRFDDYIALLNNNSCTELEHFTNAITTNLTSFFREKHHFDYIANHIVPELLDRYHPERRIRIWSAGCSTGEEPYSLAITLCESIPDIDQYNIQILATDLDSNVVQTAAAGIYPQANIKDFDPLRTRRWFQRGTGIHDGKVRIVDKVRRLITFRQLNLMREWPMHGPFDLIFCRNVMIYFDKQTQSVLFDRFANILRSDGHLIIGHSETLNSYCDRFKLVDKTLYRKTR